MLVILAGVLGYIGTHKPPFCPHVYVLGQPTSVTATKGGPIMNFTYTMNGIPVEGGGYIGWDNAQKIIASKKKVIASICPDVGKVICLASDSAVQPPGGWITVPLEAIEPIPGDN